MIKNHVFSPKNTGEKAKVQEVSPLQSRLKGVITDKEPSEETSTQILTREVQVETKIYLDIKYNLDQVLLKKKQIENSWVKLNKLEQEIAKVSFPILD